MDKEQPSRTPAVIAFALLLLPLLYVASYFALVMPQTVQRSSFVFRNGREWQQVDEVHYRLAPQASAIFYWPLEKLDRRVRPHQWKDERVRFFREGF